MTTENLAFPIPNAILEPYIKQAVSTAIACALGDGTEIVSKAVQHALATKVNDNGKVDSYGYNNKFDLVEMISRNRIIEVTKQTIQQMAEEMRPSIEKETRRLISNSTSEIARALVDGMIKGVRCDWKIKVDLSQD